MINVTKELPSGGSSMISAVLCTSISDAVFCFNLVLLLISTVVFPFLQLSFGPVGRSPASVALSAGKRQKVGVGGKLPG